MRPKKPYTPPQDQGSIDRRARFKFSAKLAQSINLVPELREVWTPVTPSGMTAFNYMVQKLAASVTPDSLTDLTLITPGTGFAIDSAVQTISIPATPGEPTVVTLAVLGNGTGIDTADEPNAKLAYVIVLGKPANGNLADFWLIGSITASQPVALDQPMTFDIPIVGSNAVSVRSYTDRKILFVLVTLDSQNNPVKYSGTLQRTLVPSD